MIVQHYKDMLGAKSVIREISEWSAARVEDFQIEDRKSTRLNSSH